MLLFYSHRLSFWLDITVTFLPNHPCSDSDDHLSNVEWITMRIRRAFPDAVFDVADTRNDDNHLLLTIQDPTLNSMSRIAAHRTIFSFLNNLRNNRVHALAIRTTTG